MSQIVAGVLAETALSPRRDGKSVAVLTGRQSIRFISIETGKMLSRNPIRRFPRGGRWTDFAIAPQAHTIAIGGFDTKEHGIVEVWDLNGRQPPRNDGVL